MTKAPAVLLASTFSNTTGFAWAFIFRLQNAIARAVHDRGCRIVLSFASIEGDVAVLDPSLPFTALTFDIHRATPASVVAFGRELRRHGVRAAYLTDWPALHWAYAVLRLAGVRTLVVHSHASIASPVVPPMGTGLRQAVKVSLQRTPFAVDHVIAVSDFIAVRLSRAGFPADRIAVVRNGVDAAQFECPERPAASPLRVFMASRATRDKGVHVLIEAVRRLASQPDLPRFIVEYAGDGPHLPQFRAQVADAGVAERFTFLGQLPDTKQRLCAADIVVVPSVWGEAFGLSAAEGMAAGKPVIASRAGGLPEITGDTAAMLVPPGDAAALADALATLLRDPAVRAALARQGRERIRTHFQEYDCRRAVVADVLAAFGMTA